MVCADHKGPVTHQNCIHPIGTGEPELVEYHRWKFVMCEHGFLWWFPCPSGQDCGDFSGA